MAQRPVVASEATSIPDAADLQRVAAFTHEPFVCDGEVAEDVLAPGTVRRHAFEFARAELDAGAQVPSQKWRRRWSLLLGLDRALHTEVPVLADGTTLNPHQVDALSGTYAALLADAQRRARGDGTSDGDALLLSFEDDEPTELDEPPPRIAPDDDAADGYDDEADEPGEDDDAASGSDDEDEDDEERTSIEDELEELPDAEPESESALYDDEAEEDVDEDIDAAALEDPNAHKRFWFEHATGAGKTVAAMGFVEACRTGGVLILTHRRNLVDQFIDELQTRGYGDRLSKPLLGDADDAGGPVTIETYQWFVRNAGQISGAYTVVICDEAHTALGEKTSATIRAWTGPIFIGMTATGALIARHVTDLFPTQTSRFDLAQAARRGVIAPLRCLRIPPGPGVRTIAKVPLRKGEVDMEFDQDELAKLLDQAPFNLAIADLYKTRFRNTPGVVYTAGVKHAYNVAESFRALDMKAEAVSGETPKRELAKILADYEAGDIDVLVNAQLLAEGWNSPRATICMHLAPTASKRIYQQRVGRVTRRHPGKEAGVVIDFVHPATSNDDPVVTLHSLLDRDVYRGGAIVVGPVRRGRGRRVKVERRVLPVTPDIERRRDVFERELWRIAVEQLDWGEQRVWAALAGAKASPTNWRRGRAMLNFDRSGELRRQFLITALERNRNPQLRMRAIQEIAVLREAEPFDTAIDHVGQWPRDERREASRTLLQAMADRRIGRRDQATAWIWRLAEYTRDVHEEYAAQRWPATKHLLGLLVNSSGAAHARNARRLVHGARQHDRRLQAALLAAAVAHTPEAEEVLREARTRLARKPGALSRDLLKDFPSGKRRKKRSRNKKKGGGDGSAARGQDPTVTAIADDESAPQEGGVAVLEGGTGEPTAEGQGSGGDGQNGGGSRRSRSRRGRSRGGRRRGGGGGGGGDRQNGNGQNGGGQNDGGRQNDGGQNGGGRGGNGQSDADASAEDTDAGDETVVLTVPVPRDPAAPADTAEDGDGAPPRRRRVRGRKAAEARAAAEAAEASAAAAPGERPAAEQPTDGEPAAPSTRTRRRTRGGAASADAAPASTADAAQSGASGTADTGSEATSTESGTKASGANTPTESGTEALGANAPAAEAAPAAPAKPKRTRRTATKAAATPSAATDVPPEGAPKPTRTRRAAKTTAPADAPAAPPAGEAETPAAAPKATPRRRATPKTAASAAAEAAPTVASADPDEPKPKPRRTRRTTTKAAATTPAASPAPDAAAPDEVAPKPTRARRTTKAAAPTADAPATPDAAAPATPDAAAPATPDAEAPKRAPRKRAAAKAAGSTDDPAPAAAAKPTRARRTATKAAPEAEAPAEAPTDAAPKAAPRKRATAAKAAATATTAAKATATKAAATKPPAKAAAKPRATKAAATKTAATKAPAKAAARTTATKAATEQAATPATGTATKATPKPRATKAAAKPAARKAPVKKPSAAKAAVAGDDGETMVKAKAAPRRTAKAAATSPAPKTKVDESA